MATVNLKESQLISSIQTLFGSDERLIYFFFNHKNPELRVPGRELLREARCLSRGEYLLVQTAIDFWNGEGHTKISDLIENLDDENFLAVIRGLLQIRGIDLEYLLDDGLC